ncbi:MAG: STAS domain-containing protein [Rhodospirillaceae bacterium]
MDFQIATSAEATEIRLLGRLTFDDHLKFNDIKQLAEESVGGTVVFDLSGLDFIDSAGLGMLVIFEDLASTAKASVTIRGARGIVRKLMDLVNFGEVIRLED